MAASGEYIPRLVEPLLESALRGSGAVDITGVRWSGKTATATRLEHMLRSEAPVRVSHSSSAAGDILSLGDRVPQPGSGIPSVRMRTMTLFESGHSTGQVGLGDLFDGRTRVMGVSDMEIGDMADELARGGWPGTIGMTPDEARMALDGYCRSLPGFVASEGGVRRRDVRRMGAVLASLSRHVSSCVPATAMVSDVNGSGRATVSINTIHGYLRDLEHLCVTDDVPAWLPRLRTVTKVRTSAKRELADPSIAAHMLGMGPDDLLMDPGTFGRLFESMAIRDLRVYAQTIAGEVSHYRDEDGLVVDAIVSLPDGRWGAVEVRLTDSWADTAARSLLRLGNKIDPSAIGPPSFLMVVTATGVARTRPDGVHVVPIGCLRNRGRNKGVGRRTRGPTGASVPEGRRKERPSPQHLSGALLLQAQPAGGRSLGMAGPLSLLTLSVPSGASRKSASSWSVG